MTTESGGRNLGLPEPPEPIKRMVEAASKLGGRLLRRVLGARRLGYGGLESTGGFLIQPQIDMSPSPTGYYHLKTWDGHFAWDYLTTISDPAKAVEASFSSHFEPGYWEQELKRAQEQAESTGGNLIIQFTPVSKKEWEELKENLPTDDEDFKETMREDKIYPFD